MSQPAEADANTTPDNPTEAPLPTSESLSKEDVLKAEMKALKIAAIQGKIASIGVELAAQRAQLREVNKELTQPAEQTVKRHIKLLHDYNDIKDVGQGLIGIIADNRGARIGDLYTEFGVNVQD